MTTFCISDLHLGNRGPRDNFCVGGRELRFDAFLDYVQEQEGELLILGDLFEWWQVTVGSAILAYLPLLNRLSENRDLTWVTGNHDNVLTPILHTYLIPNHRLFRSAGGPFTRQIGGRTFAFLHGHETDPYCRSVDPGIGQVSAILSGLREDRHKGPVDTHGRAIEDRLIGILEYALTFWRRLTFRHGRLDEMIDGVEAHRKRQNADVVVYGHTHNPGRIGTHHYNCGTWARQHDTFVRINNAGQARVWEWTDNGACLFDRVLRE